MWNVSHAVMAAVSVRNLLSPSETGVHPASNAVFISFGAKSPSGPIIIIEDVLGLYSLTNDFRGMLRSQ